MSKEAIDLLNKYMDKIYDIVQCINGFDSKDLILKKIKYTQMTIIYFRKKAFRAFYFEESGVNLAKELESNITHVIKNGKFDHKLFKQLQNIFYATIKTCR